MKNITKTFFITLLTLSVFGSTRVIAAPIDPTANVSGQTYTIPANSPSATGHTTADTGGPVFSDGTGIPLTEAGERALAERRAPDNSNLFPRTTSIGAELAAQIKKTEVESKSQAVVYDKKAQDNEVQKQLAVESAITDVVGCSAGQILANIISSAVSSALTSALGVATDVVAGIVNVPVAESGQALLNSKTQSSAQVGTTVGAFGMGVLTLPSWDSIAYCVVNAMIEYVANSTIAWIQGGFEGNPSFVNNPEQFFKDLANVEASAFLQELAYGTLGLNICEPFRAQIVLTIARNHVGNQQGYGGQGGYSQGGFGGGGNIGYGGCTLDDIKGNLEGFLGGNFESGGWDSWFQISQIDSNNPYSTYFNLQAQLDGAVNKKKTLAQQELNWGQGFLSFRKCDEKTPKEKQSDCPITSPGIVIQSQLEKTLGLAKDRLVLAEKFDQVITAVVNELINTALDKVLEVAVE